MTAYDEAKNFIKNYVLRGDSMDSLADSSMGSYSDSRVQINGYIYPLTESVGVNACIKLKRFEVGVVLKSTPTIIDRFSLKQLFNDILNEHKPQKAQQLFLF